MLKFVCDPLLEQVQEDHWRRQMLASMKTVEDNLKLEVAGLETKMKTMIEELLQKREGLGEGVAAVKGSEEKQLEA